MKKISTTCMISASIRVTKLNDIVAVNENNSITFFSTHSKL